LVKTNIFFSWHFALKVESVETFFENKLLTKNKTRFHLLFYSNNYFQASEPRHQQLHLNPPRKFWFECEHLINRSNQSTQTLFILILNIKIQYRNWKSALLQQETGAIERLKVSKWYPTTALESSMEVLVSWAWKFSYLSSSLPKIFMQTSNCTEYLITYVLDWLNYFN
jgi:hypothetical protein